MKIRNLAVAIMVAFGISACGGSSISSSSADAVAGLKVPNKVEAVAKN